MSKTPIEWRNGQPYSTLYDDIYFSTDTENSTQGIEETQYVFLQQNQLSARWHALETSQFVIAETGFGSGLNFLCASQLWLASAPSGATLHYISTEKHPLSKQDLIQIYQQWPALSTIANALLNVYDSLPTGFHTLSLLNGRIKLTLLIGDTSEQLTQLIAHVDAWFLDGFSPAKNPDMWQESLYVQMARLSHSQTTFATFTCAGHVKRGLQAVGFVTEKTPGFGKKREMLIGQFTQATSTTNTPKNRTAIVIGAGIAGCATAYALAMRGWQVQLIERQEQIADAASGNPLGVLYPRLASHANELDQLSLTSYLYTLRLIQSLALNADDFNACGLLQLGFNDRENTRITQVASREFDAALLAILTPEQASKIAGINLQHPALHFPQASWVNPRALCHALTHHDNIKLYTDTSALKLAAQTDNWQVTTNQQVLVAEHVVICNAHDALSFEQTAHLPIFAVRGQMTMVESNSESESLSCILCSDGYLSPAIKQQHCAGATFAVDDTALDIREADNLSNLQMVNKLSTSLNELNQVMQSRAALRCTTPDYLPLLGEVMDATALQENPPKHLNPPPPLPMHKGLYINVAHGAKGLTTAPLCAEALASLMSQSTLPIPMPLMQACNPNRFLLREIGLKRLISHATFSTFSID